MESPETHCIECPSILPVYLKSSNNVNSLGSLERSLMQLFLKGSLEYSCRLVYILQIVKFNYDLTYVYDLPCLNRVISSHKSTSLSCASAPFKNLQLMKPIGNV